MACGWLSLGQAARMAKLDRYAFGLELASRDIPRQYSLDDLDADLRYALAVSNTSPAIQSRHHFPLDLLREQVGTVTVPAGVWAELSRLPNLGGQGIIRSAIQAGWLRVFPGPRVPDDLAISLDKGEAEALALALETKARLVLLDESAARLKAQQLRDAPHRRAGLLRKARNDGWIGSLKAEILRLRTEARFFVAPDWKRDCSSSVGET